MSLRDDEVGLLNNQDDALDQIKASTSEQLDATTKYTKSIKKDNKQKDPQANILYLLGLTLTLGLSTMQVGFNLSATGPVSAALRYQLKWGNDQAAIDFYTTVLSTSSIMGVAIGNIFGGDFVSYGRRITIIRFNLLGLIGTLFTLYLNFWSMCFGRLVFGLSCGVLICTTCKMIDEIIPSKLIDQGFGASTSIALNFGCFFVLLAAMGMPQKAEELQTTSYWYVIYGLQIPVQLLIIFLHGVVYTEDTPTFCMKNNKVQEAKAGLRKIYSTESESSINRIYETQSQQIAQQQQGQQEDNAWNQFTSPQTRGAAWVSVITAFFNNMGGISIINIFSTVIFMKVHEGASSHKFSLQQENFYVGVSGVVGGILSIWTVKYLSRRAIFIGGHFFIGVTLMLAGYYTYVKQPELVLISICLFIVTYQATQGTAFFIYVSEIVSSDSVMGMCLFIQMLMQNAESMTVVYLMSSKVGVSGLFYLLGGIQVIPFLWFSMVLKETKGKTDTQKKQLYNKVDNKQN